MEASLVIASPIPVQRVQHLTEVGHQWRHGTPDQKGGYIFRVPSQHFPLPPWILVCSSIEIKIDSKSWDF